MTQSRFQTKEIVIFVIVAVLSFCLLMVYRANSFHRRAEIEAESKQWMGATDPEVIEHIKEPIDRINWGYYIGQYAEGVAHPDKVLDSYFGESHENEN